MDEVRVDAENAAFALAVRAESQLLSLCYFKGLSVVTLGCYSVKWHFKLVAKRSVTSSDDHISAVARNGSNPIPEILPACPMDMGWVLRNIPSCHIIPDFISVCH